MTLSARSVFRWLMLAGGTCAGWLSCSGSGTDHDFVAARKRMIDRQIVARGITNERVLKVMGAVPRHELVPASHRHHAYVDEPVPIGHGQTMSQPYVVALMTELLDAKGTDRILEIGTGSGYQAAVLSGLVREVHTIEIVRPLAERARGDLARLGYTNVHVKAGDGYKGWAEAGPFDAVIVTCAPDAVPQPLVDQLKEGGRMVIPVGSDTFHQELYLLEKKGGKVEKRSVLPVRFVPMTRDKK